MRPYAQWRYKLSEKFTARIGLGLSLIDQRDPGLEPLFIIEFQPKPAQILSLRYRSVHMSPAHYTSAKNPLTQWPLPDNELLDLVEVQSLDITYATDILSGTFEISAFYHSIRDALIAFVSFDPLERFSMLNLNALPPNFPMENVGDGASFGIKTAYRQSFFNDYFLSANLSIFDAKYTDYAGVERSTTFDIGHAFYAAAGKEWTSRKDYGTRTFGANLAVIHNGGLREPVIDEAASLEADRTIYDPGTYGEVQLDDYFRIDARLYLRKDKANRSTTWSLDIQNLTSRENAWLSRYDLFTESVMEGTQLGIIPVLSYRVDF